MKLENSPSPEQPSSHGTRYSSLEPGKVYQGTITRSTRTEIVIQTSSGPLVVPGAPGVTPGTAVFIHLDAQGRTVVEPARGGHSASAVAGGFGSSSSSVQFSQFPGLSATLQLPPMTNSAYFGKVADFILPGVNMESGEFLIELAGSRIPVHSEAGLSRGEFIHFTLDENAGRFTLNLVPYQEGAPAAFSQWLSSSGLEYHPGFRAAYDVLAPFAGENFFSPAMRDFGNLLIESGLFSAPPPSQPNGEADSSGPGKLDVAPSDLKQFLKTIESAYKQNEIGTLGQAIRAYIEQNPAYRFFSMEQVESLFGVFINSHREAEMAAVQSMVWGAVTVNPFSALALLENLVPAAVPGDSAREPSAHDSVILKRETLLLPAGPGFFPEGMTPAGPATLAEYIRMLDVLDSAGRLSVEHKLNKFVFQALEAEVKSEKDSLQGNPMFSFYQSHGRWNGVQFRWRMDEKKGKGRKSAVLRVNLATITKNMGQVIVETVLEPRGVEINFKNDHGNVRDLLACELPELEKRLAYMDFKVRRWTYFPIQKKPASGRKDWDAGTQPLPVPGGDGHLDIKI